MTTETERAALEGDTATLQVFAQEARNRKLAGVEKVNFDVAFKKLRLEELDSAGTIFTELEGLAQEADALFLLWREPNNQVAQANESLGRFNRKKKIEAAAQTADKAPTRPVEDPEQSSAA